MMTVSTDVKIAVTARALVIRDAELLLVSNDGEVWYTPGGRLQVGESLHDCVRREVYEETGCHVTVGDLVHVFEYWEEEHRRHKVECYFIAQLDAGELDSSWKDMDGPVSHIKFFSPQEMTSAKVYPEFLLQGAWSRPGLGQGVYQGFEK